MSKQPPWTIAIGASGANGLRDLRDLLHEWSHLDAVVMIVLHRPWTAVSHLQDILQRSCRMPVVIANESERLRPGRVYLGEPSNHLMMVANALGSLHPDPHRIHRNRTVDLLFNSLATYGGQRIIGVVLSGALDDGSRGMKAINEAGGRTVVVTPDRLMSGMPENAISYDGPIDVIGDVPTIARAVEDIVLRG